MADGGWNAGKQRQLEAGAVRDRHTSKHVLHVHPSTQVLISYGDQTLEEERAQERVTLAHTARYGMLQQEVMMRLSEVRFNDVIPMYSQDADGVAAE